MDEITNYAVLKGTAAGRPVFSHCVRQEEFWRFPLEVERLSGTTDKINILARRELLEALEPESGEKLLVTGQVRSFNNRTGPGSRLVITVFARSIAFADGADTNEVRLMGTLCRAPGLRRTPLGRDISDMMLAVQRRYGRYDYLPCIAWGRQAEEAAGWQAHDRVLLTGRIQSRNYMKLLETGSEERTAFEVSAVTLRRITEPDGRSPEFPCSPEA
ncbi:MAG: single-stranded DNA-binding protein [Oscillospiraceae bacterium]|nr:single-stranded DNA-binding protein [Oscillospiraceae bacterium]